MFSILDPLRRRWRVETSPRIASVDGTPWLGSKSDIGVAIAVGWATGLLTYDVLQLASAAGWPIVKVDPRAISLFVRWRGAMLVGVMGAVATRAISDHELASKIASWAVSLACFTLLLVVVFAP